MYRVDCWHFKRRRVDTVVIDRLESHFNRGKINHYEKWAFNEASAGRRGDEVSDTAGQGLTKVLRCSVQQKDEL